VESSAIFAADFGAVCARFDLSEVDLGKGSFGARSTVFFALRRFEKVIIGHQWTHRDQIRGFCWSIRSAATPWALGLRFVSSELHLGREKEPATPYFMVLEVRYILAWKTLCFKVPFVN
jgi:hypothetical protein